MNENIYASISRFPKLPFLLKRLSPFKNSAPSNPPGSLSVRTRGRVESVRPVRPTESYSTWYPFTPLSRISSWTSYHQELSTLGGNVRRHYISCPFPLSANDAIDYIDYIDYIEDQGSLQILSDSLIDTTPTCFYTKNFKLASADLQSDVRTTTNSSSQFYKIFTIAQS
jgi:hypothetical protein